MFVNKILKYYQMFAGSSVFATSAFLVHSHDKLPIVIGVANSFENN